MEREPTAVLLATSYRVSFPLDTPQKLYWMGLDFSKLRRLLTQTGKSCFGGRISEIPRPAEAMSQRLPLLSSPLIKGGLEA